MAYLILVRHGMSDWNKKGLWTGLRDISLCEEGRIESQKIADKLKDIKIDIAFTSKLLRSTETLDEIIKKLNLINLPVIEHEALNERDYGVYTGKNKWEVKKQFGEDMFQKIRRAWDYPIEKGETLKDVYDRVIPYYQSNIEPELKKGKNVLVVSHGNTLRAIIKYLEHISDRDISNIEMETGEIYIYEIDHQGIITSKEGK